MVLDFAVDEEFFASLTRLDAELARQVAASGCRWCGGRLHRANYQRKPRGGLLAEVGEAFTIRHSLCCGAEGCRRRALPPSLRFLGRRVYLEVVVLLACMVAQLVSTLREACAATGVPSWTLRRWRGWWRTAFVQSPTWAELRARLAPPPPSEADLPRSLVVRIEAELRRRGPPPPIVEVCRLVARLLAPATSSSVPDGSRFVRGLAEASALG
jgi:hypothetical protein